MKWFILILLILSPLLRAETNFVLSHVSVDCSNSDMCEARKTRYENLVGDYRSLLHLKETLRIIASDGGYQSFFYEILESDGENSLTIHVRIKSVVQTINVGFTDRNIELDPSLLINIKEGDFFEIQKVKESVSGLHEKLDSMGFPDNTHSLEVIEKDGKAIINLSITLGEPRIFKSLNSNATSRFVNDFLSRKFNYFYNKPFEINKFKFYLDEAQKELFSYGYFLIGLDFAATVKDHRVILDVKVTNDKIFALEFENLENESREVIHALVKDLFRKYKRPLPEGTLKLAIQEHYRTRALLNVEVDIQMSEFDNMYKEKVHLYRIKLSEKYKTQMPNVNFVGNSFFTNKDLKKMFEKQAFELASIHLYDEEFINYFSGYLKSQYIEHGYVQVNIQGPNKTFDAEKKDAYVDYVISEGPLTTVKSISFEGVPHELEADIQNHFKNKEGKPFNPVLLVEDIKQTATYLQENGYYFAEVMNANDENLVTYSRTGSEVDIHLVVDAGSIVRLNRIIYLGNNKTKKKVFLKKVTIKKDELITPSKTREIEAKISATGLFNTVSVAPMKHNSKSAATDLIVKVSERDYGLVEMAPGYRTDIGIKLTGTISYLNIGGLNRTITMRSQINQRLNYQTFDQRRRRERRKILEHNNTLTFTQGDIFDTAIDSSTALSFQRKRFYSFDADILRLSNTFTKDFTSRFASSLRYQYEAITQTDATQDRDNGSFKIGAVTPSLTYDLRNSATLPVKGSFFNLSCEFANPYFFSQKTTDLTVNYYKLVSRNRFYIPYKNGTLAISFVGGMQENLANNEVTQDGVTHKAGYIPNIKVFRLTGMDIVRGFTDYEINRLSNKKDISEVRVEDKAFIANFKFEPRYFINDTLMTGVFFDAGRVYVDSVDLGDLRTSAGVTFKILTPVGTLDFDYGFKLNRRRVSDGNSKEMEVPGRFHVSIGFF